LQQYFNCNVRRLFEIVVTTSLAAKSNFTMRINNMSLFKKWHSDW